MEGCTEKVIFYLGLEGQGRVPKCRRENFQAWRVGITANDFSLLKTGGKGGLKTPRSRSGKQGRSWFSSQKSKVRI